MHLLETYSLSTASKIDKPFIYSSYFPLPFEKYITFQAQSKFNSKNYDYWQIVINILYPVLEKANIKIVQVGQAHEFGYQYVMDIRGRTNISQLSYVIQKSNLHFGPDSLGIHMASHFDTPCVGLYSCSPSTISGPYFGSKEKQVLFDAYKNVKNAKPSYAAEENPKSINTIKPEEIADSIFKLLKIDYKTPFTTEYIGEKYSNQILRELVPNFNFNLGNPDVPIEVRMDLHFDEQILEKQLAINKCIVVTNKPVNIEILKRFKPHVLAVIYHIEKDDTPAFVESIKSSGMPFGLVSYLTKEEIETKKLTYYNYGVIHFMQPTAPELADKLRKNFSDLFFQSNKVIGSNGRFYMSNAGRVSESELKTDFNYHKAVDCPEFWRELPFMHVIKKTA